MAGAVACRWDRSPGVGPRAILYRPIDDRVDLADDLAGDRQDVIDSIVYDVAPNLQSDASGTLLGITVPTTAAANAAEALTLRRPGLYPVTVQVVAGDTVIAEHHTFIERLPVDPSTAPPMNVALIAGIDDPGADADRERVGGRAPPSRRAG